MNEAAQLAAGADAGRCATARGSASHPLGDLNMSEPTASCVACKLTRGEDDLPGGRVFETAHWVAEHCVGPLGVGTLILKPFRHVVRVADLSRAEAEELGPLLTLLTGAIGNLSNADQVYTCLWSHKDWEPVHIHFVLQPSWKHLQARFPAAGPTLQAAMFERGELPDRDEVEQYCNRMRDYLHGARVG